MTAFILRARRFLRRIDPNDASYAEALSVPALLTVLVRTGVSTYWSSRCAAASRVTLREEGRARWWGKDDSYLAEIAESAEKRIVPRLSLRNMGGLLRKLARTLTSPSSIFNAIFRLFRIRTRRACGVILTHIGSAVEQTPDLFGVMARDARQERLFEILDAIKRWRLFHL